jgi:outer membrane immunogenic protein
MTKTAAISAAILLTTGWAASAADLPRPVYKAPVVAQEPIYWTGCYIGGNAGYAWVNTRWSDPARGEFTSQSPDGAIGGGQIGCDYQMNRLVVGFQGMWDATGLKDSSRNALDRNLVDSSRTPWIASLTGRIGITGSPTLYFVKGGAAWVNGKFEECCFVAPPPPPPIIIPDGFAKETRLGWTLGGGIEHIFVKNWSVFVEYNYVRVNDGVQFTGINGFSNFTYNIDQNIHSVIAGINYRF